MQKIMRMALCVIVITSALSSCKKGDDDPFLSLRTRKARLVGAWTMKARTSRYVLQNSYSSHITTGIYANGRENIVHTYDDMSELVQADSTTRTYTLHYTFSKDGSYQKVNISELGSSTEDGVWSFVNKSKTDDLKNKEAILIILRLPMGILIP
jgi:hypothetical protein